MFGGSFMLKFEWTGFSASSVERRVMGGGVGVGGWVVGLIHAKFKVSVQVAMKEGWFRGVGSYTWRFKWTEFSASSLEGGVV